MKISYDSQVDALYIRLIDAEAEVTMQRLSDDVAVDYAPNGDVVGIEILDASIHAFHPDAKPQVVIQNLTPIVA